MNDSLFLPANLFQGEEHQPLSLDGYPAAALLIHGFPGSPAEMRPLARVIHQQNWSVESMLLPGFGPQIHQLADISAEQWIEAACDQLASLQHKYHPVVVGGFSMGAAIAMIAASRLRADGVILMAPYWRLSSFLWHFIPFLSLVFKQIKPFQLAKIDPHQPEVRAGIEEFMPGLDLNDPQVLQGIQQFSIPTSIFVELRKVGTEAKQAASLLTTNSLILQGINDRLVEPAKTRTLMQGIPGRVHYLELEAEHDLADPTRPAWSAVTTAVQTFLSSFE
jgi:carboxylesterase